MIDATLLLIRLSLGLTFILHGWDKYSPDAAAYMEKWFTTAGVPFPRMTLSVVRSLEVLGGIAVALGIGAYAAPVALIIIMLGAVKMAHFQINPRVTANGWEFNGLITASLVLLAVNGFGQYALDTFLS